MNLQDKTLGDRTQGVHGELETQSPQDRKDRKWGELKELMDTAWRGSMEFRNRMEKAGLNPTDIRSFEQWPEIPVFRKKELIGLQTTGAKIGGLLTCDIGDLQRIYQSPGPIFDPEGRGDDYWGWTEGFYAAGFRKKDVVQMTFGYHLTPAGLMLEQPLRELGCAVIPAGPGNTAVQIELMTELPVTGFVGMASYLRVIADKAASSGLDLKKDFHLRVAFVAAERLSESLRRGLELDFGMLVRQGYGTADLGCVAYECPHLGGMHTASRCYVEICDPETGRPLPLGETGEVVATPFTHAYPLIRFATGDLSYFVDRECACGRTSLKLGGIVGRVDDTAKVKGQFIYPAQAAEVMAAFPGVSGWQIVVENPKGKDALFLKVRLDGDFDLKKCETLFQKRLKLRPVIEILPKGEDMPEDAPLLVDNRHFS